MEELILYDYLYDKKEIEFLQRLCKNVKWERKDDTLDYDLENNKNLNGNRYIANIAQYINYTPPEKIVNSYMDYVPYLYSMSLTNQFIESKGYTPDIKISKYGIGDDYNWHCDFERRFEDNCLWSRQISSITYLNDDYEGGETEFACGLFIKPKMGKTVVFPSNWCFTHKGRPVIKGTKYICVLHIWS
jgi:hypothetical protein